MNRTIQVASVLVALHSPLYAGLISISSGGPHLIDSAYQDPADMMALGTDDAFLIENGVTVNFDGGADLPTQNNIDLTADGARDTDESVTIIDNSIVNIREAEIQQDVSAYGTSTVNVFTDADLEDDLWSDDAARINVFGGEIAEDVGAFGSSRIDFSGGRAIGDLFAEEFSTINFSGGMVDSDVEAYSSGTVNVTGGRILSDVQAFGIGGVGGVVNISGGEVADNLEADGGTIRVTGGTLFTTVYADPFEPHIYTVDNGLIEFFGTEFFVDGIPFLGGSIFDETGTIYGTLSGTLTDGSSFSPVFFDLAPNCGCIPEGTIQINVVPEPSSFLLSSILLSLGLWNRRRPAALS